MNYRHFYFWTVIIPFTTISLQLFSQSTTEIARKGISSTVSIVSLDKNMQPLGFGSGFIVDNQTVVTNVHVIEGASKVYILKTNDATKYNVSGYSAIDKLNDIVVLKVENFYGTSLPLGDGSIPEIGERIYAIGNPKGLNGTFSEGIVSGVRDFENRQVLQITAPISPGSSGGPILNSNGNVVGVAFGSFSSGQNLNFAAPIKYLHTLLQKQGAVQQVSLVKPQPKSQSQVNGNVKDGVQVRNIEAHIEDGYFSHMTFSVKNNLGYNISDIRILFIVFDYSGVIVDSFEGVFFRRVKEFAGIRPFLARSFDGYKGTKDLKIKDYYEHFYENSVEPSDMVVKSGYKIIGRVLDFRINE